MMWRPAAEKLEALLHGYEYWKFTSSNFDIWSLSSSSDLPCSSMAFAYLSSSCSQSQSLSFSVNCCVHSESVFWLAPLACANLGDKDEAAPRSLLAESIIEVVITDGCQNRVDRFPMAYSSGAVVSTNRAAVPSRAVRWRYYLTVDNRPVISLLPFPTLTSLSSATISWNDCSCVRAFKYCNPWYSILKSRHEVPLFLWHWIPRCAYVVVRLSTTRGQWDCEIRA